MTDVVVSWDLPTVSLRQKPIKHVEVHTRDDESLPWTFQNSVLPGDVQQMIFADEPPGRHYYQAFAVDEDDVAGSPSEGIADVPFDAPSALVNFDVTLT